MRITHTYSKTTKIPIHAASYIIYNICSTPILGFVLLYSFVVINSLLVDTNRLICLVCFAFISRVCRVESSSQLPSAPENNRNYYNATSNQEYNNPTQYNSYFSVYDDEAEDTGDLYRDGK